MTFRVSNRMHRISTGLGACFAAGVAVLMTGCGASYKPGGDGFARDAFTYPSTSHVPLTVQLRDTRTSEILWSYEIPPDRELVVHFYKGRNADNLELPDEMRWEEWELGRTSGGLENKMPVPSENYRRMDVYVRKPEPTPVRETP